MHLYVFCLAGCPTRSQHWQAQLSRCAWWRPQSASSLSGSVVPFCHRWPPSRVCGSPVRSTWRPAQASCTGSASKHAAFITRFLASVFSWCALHAASVAWFLVSWLSCGYSHGRIFRSPQALHRNVAGFVRRVRESGRKYCAAILCEGASELNLLVFADSTTQPSFVVVHSSMVLRSVAY